MTDQDRPPPKAPRGDDRPPQTAPAATGEGVRRQRRHIRELTGQDPLRGGIDD